MKINDIIVENKQLDEANANIISDRELNSLVKSKKAVYWRSSGFNKLPNDKFFYIPILDKNKNMLGVYKAYASESDQEYEYLDSMLKDVREEVELDELTAGEVGTAVGKGVGAVAKGVGAVAGGIAGAGKAFMKGFRGGKAVVGGTDTPGAKAAPAGAPGAKAAPGQKPAAPGQKPAAPGAQPTAQAAPQAVDMKAIQDAIAKLPQNQRMSLRAIVAKKAGVK